MNPMNEKHIVIKSLINELLEIHSIESDYDIQIVVLAGVLLVTLSFVDDIDLHDTGLDTALTNTVLKNGVNSSIWVKKRNLIWELSHADTPK